MHPAAEAIRAQRLVAIIRRGRAEEAVTDGLALLNAGVRAIEVSLLTPDAFTALVGELRQIVPVLGRTMQGG